MSHAVFRRFNSQSRNEYRYDGEREGKHVVTVVNASHGGTHELHFETADKAKAYVTSHGTKKS